MAIPYPIDPSLPSNPSPLFSDATAVRGDHMRANNEQIWANFIYIVNTILAGAVLSTDGTMAADSDLKFPSEKAVRAYIAAQFNALLPVGFETYWPGITPPENWIVRDGSNLLRASYPSLFSAIAPVTSGLTMTLAAPCVLTLNNHGLQSYQCVSLETTGNLPSIFTPGLGYYVRRIDVNTFHLCTSIANVTAKNYISTLSLSQSGIHSLRYSSYGSTDLTHFNIPDDRGIHIVGTGTQGTATGWKGLLSNHVGVQGYYNEDGFQIHRHQNFGNNTTADQYYPGGNFNAGGSTNAKFRTTGADLMNVNAVALPTTDGIHGTPRGGGYNNSGYITSPARVGHLPIIKYQ